jgi:DNA-directed RNA polymerase subunit F
MTNTSDGTSSSPSVSDAQKQPKKSLQEFFQQKSVKSLVSVLVPGILAAALFPVLPPVATIAAAVAVKNALDAVHISLSTPTIEKILKPMEGKPIEESDVQEVIEDLLKTDKTVNEETAKALVTVAPTIKEAALSNPKLGTAWLAENMAANLKEQGEVMARIAPEMRLLLQKDGEELTAEVQRLLQNWSRISVEVTATNKSKISGVDSHAQARGGAIGHTVTAKDESTIENIKMNSQIS